MDISAKSDYAVRAMLTLASAGVGGDPVAVERLAADQGLPKKFLEAIVADLRRSELVASRRGARGGYVLARPASEITLGDVIRAVDGPLAEVRGLRPQQTSYSGAAEHLPQVWVAVRAALRHVLDGTSIADVASGELPQVIHDNLTLPGAWDNR